MNSRPPGVTRISHLNIRSISDKKPKILDFIITNQVSICILSETWLQNKHKFAIPHYEIVRKDRDSRGGGILVALHKDVAFQQVTLPPQLADLELIVIILPKLTHDNKDVTLVAYYNPPQNKVDLGKIESFTNSLNNPTLVIGDLNAHSPMWLSKKANSSGSEVEAFLEEKEFTLLNNEDATYESESDSDYKCILDLALCSDQLLPCIINYSVGEFCSSDHNPVFVDVLGKQPPRFGKISKEVKTTSWDKFALEMNSFNAITPAPAISSRDELELAAARLTEDISHALQLATSTKTVNFDPHGFMVLPRYIVSLIKAKSKLRRAHAKACDQEKQYLKAAINRHNYLIQWEINNWKLGKWKNFCTKLNSLYVSNSTLWTKLKSIEGSQAPKSRKQPKLQFNNNLIVEPEQVANIFANTLEEVFQDANDPANDAIFKTLVDNSSSCLFTTNEEPIAEVTVSEVASLLKDARSKGAPGEDNITNRCLKSLPCSTIPRLVSIFNASINLGQVPSTWKKAIVTMIPKPLKDHSKPANFRPISLLNCLSKLLERVILSRLQKWITGKNLISTLQCGFRKHRQTKDQILRIVQDGIASFNENERMGAIFIDIEKAFDRVWHNGLLFKLNHLGISNYLGNWIRDYLDQRTFQVRVGSSLSSPKFIRAGVPQGSVLGPVLFNLFFNDITDSIAPAVSIGLFADDLSAWTSNRNVKQINKNLQAQLDRTEQWMNTWRTKLSSSKTIWTLFSNDNRCTNNQMHLTYGNAPIAMDRNPKFLGVTLDPGLRFHTYVKLVRDRTLSRLNMLKRIRGKNWGASSKLILITYKALIRPILEYVPFLTLIMANTNLLTLEKIQRRAARQVIYWPIKTSTADIYRRINIEDIPTRSIKLTDRYISTSWASNDLIRSLINNYKTNQSRHEGDRCNHRPRLTILGSIKTNPAFSLSQQLITKHAF